MRYSLSEKGASARNIPFDMSARVRPNLDYFLINSGEYSSPTVSVDTNSICSHLGALLSRFGSYLSIIDAPHDHKGEIEQSPSNR